MHPEWILASSRQVIALSWQSMVMVGLMMVAAGVLSVVLHLGVLRAVATATVRSVLQLLAVGMVIGWVFSHDAWYWVIGLLSLMTVIAGLTAASRVGFAVRGLRVGMVLILGSCTALSLMYLSWLVIGIDSWSPRYLVPLGGMLLGNAMTAGTLSAERLKSEFTRHVVEIEAMLSLGASPYRVVQEYVPTAIRAGLMPTLNSMMLVGVVTLPGMMTGQMLGGSSPMQAALYQLLILFAILFTNTLSAAATVFWLYRSWFTESWQLRIDRLKP